MNFTEHLDDERTRAKEARGQIETWINGIATHGVVYRYGDLIIADGAQEATVIGNAEVFAIARRYKVLQQENTRLAACWNEGHRIAIGEAARAEQAVQEVARLRAALDDLSEALLDYGYEWPMVTITRCREAIDAALTSKAGQ